MKRSAELQILGDNELIKYETLFAMIREVLGGVILYKYFKEIVAAPSRKIQQWERYGLIETRTIANNKIIILKRNKILNLQKIRLTPILVFRSSLRMEKYLEKGIKDPTEIYNQAMKGNDRANIGGDISERMLNRQEKMLNERNINVRFSGRDSVSTLEQLRKINIYSDGIAYDTKTDNLILKPYFSYYVLYGESETQILKRLMLTYHAAQFIYGDGQAIIKPKITIYSYSKRGDEIEKTVYKLLAKEKDFQVKAAGNQEYIKSVFKFKFYKRPFSYIDVENVL